jgi:hypothetical protein
MFARLVGAFAVAAGLMISQAQAHGGVTMDKDRCVLRIGPEAMHFSGYQPVLPGAEFCEDIPNLGPTDIVLEEVQLDDAAQKELRKMTTEIRVIKDVGPEVERNGTINDITEAYLPPAKHPSGVVNFQHNFTHAGKYIGLIIVRGENDTVWVSRFPFMVGLERPSKIDFPLMIAVGGSVLAFAASYVVYRFRRRANLAKRP